MPRGLNRSAMFLIAAAAFVLAGCASTGQSRYTYQDVGRASVVEFGTVLAARTVEIQGRNSGFGGATGAAAGGIAMAGVGQGTGNAAAILGGVVAGAIAGAVAEQALSDRNGVEYVIALANGKTITIVQEIAPGDQIFEPGSSVMVQASGTYQRVLSASHLPDTVTRPKSVQVVN